MMKTDHPKKGKETKLKKNLKAMWRQLRLLEGRTGQQDQAQEQVQEQENSLNS